MNKVGTKALTAAFKKGLSIAFRGESLDANWFMCRAEWEEDGRKLYANGQRFQCDSDRKADFMAEQIMSSQLAVWVKEEPNQLPEPTSGLAPGRGSS